MNITLIGTSHIARESVNKVKKTIKEQQPDIVAVELDARRFYALTHQSKKQKFSFYAISRVGLKGFLFAMIGSWATKKLGRMVGVDPGEEMLTAIKLAKKNKITVALIDRDIEITLSRLSRYLTWKERWNFFVDLFNGLFFRKREMKKLGIDELDLSKVPSEVLIKKLIGMMKKRYPGLYMVLVHERNLIMANKLKELAIANPEKKIVAVVGAGHIEGMTKILSTPTFSYGFTVDSGSVEWM